MLNLLILKPYLADTNSDACVDHGEHHFMGNFNRLDWINHTVVYYDQQLKNSTQLEVLEYINDLYKDRNFDVVLIKWTCNDIPSNLKIESLYKLKEMLGIPFIFTWWDSYWPEFGESGNYMSWFGSISDLNIYLDSPKYMYNNDKCEFYPSIFDCTVFPMLDNERNIDVCFNGTIIPRQDRINLINELIRNDINVNYHSSSVYNNLPLQEYVNIYQRSKISLNLSNDIYRIKGRIYESTFCGCLLFEDYNKITSTLFEPEKEYIMWLDICDLIDKIEYYLDHDEEREKIALAGHKKAIELCEPNNYWKKVFDRLGFKIEEEF